MDVECAVTATWQFEPLGPWTRPVTNPRQSSGRFSAGWTDTLNLLEREVEHLNPQWPVVIRADVDPTSVLRNGMIRASARSGFPGVVVSLRSLTRGSLTFATDAYEQRYSRDYPGWQANLRAIALSLEALRAVDRYGVTRSGEQYVGWQSIEAAPAPFTTADEALRWMRNLRLPDAPAVTSTAQLYRALAKRMHPDVGGDPKDWARLDQARQLLEAAGVL